MARTTCLSAGGKLFRVSVQYRALACRCGFGSYREGFAKVPAGELEVDGSGVVWGMVPESLFYPPTLSPSICP